MTPGYSPALLSRFDSCVGAASAAPTHALDQGLGSPLPLAKPDCGADLVREGREVRDVAAVDAVAELDLVPLQEAGHHALGDVDDVVAEPAAVREAAVVAADDAEAVDLARRGHRDRVVEPQHVGDVVAGVVEALDAGAEHGDEVVAVRLGALTL